MQEEKSFAYTIILGVCILLCLLMIGRMLLGHPDSDIVPEMQSPAAPEQEEIGMQLEENDLCTLIEQTLPFPMQQITAKIGADERISIVVLVSKQDLQQSGLVPGSLRTVLLFMPDECRLYGVWKAASADGKVVLECERAEIGGAEIPIDIISALTDQVEASINDFLTEKGIAPDRIEWSDGALTLKV